MKILALNGSYRANGNTFHVLSLIEEELRRAAEYAGTTLDLEIVNLGHLKLEPCRGCRICFDRGEQHCPLKDDLLPLKAKMKQADGILVASPVYVNDVNGVTKNWIDRLAHVCHRPEFAGKCVYLLATVGGGPTSHALLTLNMALRTWGVYLVGQMGFNTGASMKADEVRRRYEKQTIEVANKLFRAIHERHFMSPSFLSLMTFRIQQWAWQQTNDDSLDYRYWTDQGWIDPRRTFYTEQRANRVKVTLARFVGRVIAPFVS